MLLKFIGLHLLKINNNKVHQMPTGCNFNSKPNTHADRELMRKIKRKQSLLVIKSLEISKTKTFKDDTTRIM